MRKYEHNDIVLADDMNRCYDLSMTNIKKHHWDNFTHDAVIVGHGKYKDVTFWLVRQSWTEQFGVIGGY